MGVHVIKQGVSFVLSKQEDMIRPALPISRNNLLQKPFDYHSVPGKRPCTSF